MLSLAHKRWSQNEAGKVVLDGSIVEVALPGTPPSSAIETGRLQVIASVFKTELVFKGAKTHSIGPLVPAREVRGELIYFVQKYYKLKCMC